MSDRAAIRRDVFAQMDALPHRYMTCADNARAMLCDACRALADRVREIPWWGA